MESLFNHLIVYQLSTIDVTKKKRLTKQFEKIEVERERTKNSNKHREWENERLKVPTHFM